MSELYYYDMLGEAFREMVRFGTEAVARARAMARVRVRAMARVRAMWLGK